MQRELLISPSILSADFLNLEHDIAMIEDAGADWVHIDVMDGHFVPNLTMGVPLVSRLKAFTKLDLDVHLMISNPLVQVPWFLDAGADYLTCHYESFADDDECARTLELIKGFPCGAALAIKPDTPVARLFPFLKYTDMVLIMSVYPGFSGQSFIEGSDARAKALVEHASALGYSPRVQMDGGIGLATVEKAARAGVDVFVCGNAVFKAANPSRAIAEIKAKARAARGESLLLE